MTTRPYSSPPFVWNTWTTERPAELVHPASQFRITPVLYSDRAASATDLPPGASIQYGPRSLQTGQIEFRTFHEDTELDWVCERPSEQDVRLSWACRANGEWGLRYWVVICVSGPEGVAFHYDEEAGVISGSHDGHTLRIRADKKPLLVTGHDRLCDVMQEFETRGYFYLESRATEAPLLAMRFNLDEASQMGVLATLSAVDKPEMPAEIALPTTDSAPQQALQAIYDALAWNHVVDPINMRNYTALTRAWNRKKFGGFGVWLNDNLFHALLWSLIDPVPARENVDAAFAGQTDAGNFPCLVTGNDAWLDRSQPPIASYVIWSLYRAAKDPELLGWAYPKLLRNHAWWWNRRVLGNSGLVAYGTSADQGQGLYIGTKLAAKNESSMDNMAVHDEADFDAGTGLIQAADVGLNALLALDGEILSAMASELGKEDDAAQLTDRTGTHKARISDHLWDPARGVFTNRRTDGRFVEAIAPTSFFPMVAGIATDAQARALVEQYLRPEDKFGGAYTLPASPRDQPAFRDNVYWRGRVWGPLNFWVYQGLQRYGYRADAAELATKSLDMFNTHWAARKCGENYNATTGEIQDQPDAEPFYTWGALLPALSVMEVVSDTLWNGLSLHILDPVKRLGPVRTWLGALAVSPDGNGWVVSFDTQPLIAGTGAVLMTQVAMTTDRFSAIMTTKGNALKMDFPGRVIAQATLSGQSISHDQNRIYLPPGSVECPLDVTFV